MMMTKDFMRRIVEKRFKERIDRIATDLFNAVIGVTEAQRLIDEAEADRKETLDAIRELEVKSTVVEGS